jgi:hypothetical protein
MKLKERLFNNVFYRNILTDLGFRMAYAEKKNEYSFFQYRIGSYKPDYYLYFPREPLAIRYNNEIFNKLREYQGFEISEYLDFHYNASIEKSKFLRFLQYEAGERIKLDLGTAIKSKLNFVLQWIGEKQSQLQTVHEKFHANTIVALDEYSDDTFQQFRDRFDRILSGFEEKLEDLGKTHNNGNVHLVNSAHVPKLIQLFILLRDLRTPYKKGNGQENLFESFSSSDLASLLQRHFAFFHNKKLNTIQKEIVAYNSQFDINHENVKKLNRALVEYFFEK